MNEHDFPRDADMDAEPPPYDSINKSRHASSAKTHTLRLQDHLWLGGQHQNERPSTRACLSVSSTASPSLHQVDIVSDLVLELYSSMQQCIYTITYDPNPGIFQRKSAIQPLNLQPILVPSHQLHVDLQ